MYMCVSVVTDWILRKRIGREYLVAVGKRESASALPRAVSSAP